VNILVNKAHYPVSVLGYGKRIGIWLQGCSIHCPSCCSRDTWGFDKSRGMEVVSLVEWCREVAVDSLDGVTISGGEPFDQPDALLGLLEALCNWRREVTKPFDILLYSGYSEPYIKREFVNHQQYLDAVVAGPFRESLVGQKRYCGSENQQMLIFSALAEQRYGVDGLEDWKSGMQANADAEGIWMIGIPRPKDLERFEAGCIKKGLILGKPSWRC
jgi:anaerobic ribonucleoside-triphosphate reductase activating protein